MRLKSISTRYKNKRVYLKMREILFHSNTSGDLKRKDIRITEKIFKSNTSAVCSKHIRYIIKVLGKLDDVSNLDDVVLKQLSGSKTPERHVYIKKRISKNNKLKSFKLKTDGCMYLVYKELLLCVKYIYDLELQTDSLCSNQQLI